MNYLILQNNSSEQVSRDHVNIKYIKIYKVGTIHGVFNIKK